MIKKVSRRDFARTSVAAGAAAVTLPSSILGNEPPAGTMSSAAAKGATAAKRRRLIPPPEVAYGGMSVTGRDLMLHNVQSATQTETYPGGWLEGTTIPAEYYTEEKHYLNDERAIAENFWLMVDHQSRISKPGDYFVFEFGRGESLIIARAQDGAVKAFHNVCRHRGSRLCLHDFDGVLPSEAKSDGKPIDPKLSVVQLGGSGNTPVFRCPYHAWTYDLQGSLVSVPPGMPTGFDLTQHGLHAAHVRLSEGFIFVSFAREDPPDFDAFVTNWQSVCQDYGTAQLKVVARKKYPTKANWKLALENFRECYHCQPSHTQSYFAVHNLQFLYLMTPDQRSRIEAELARHGHPLAPPSASRSQAQRRDDLVVEAPRGSGGMAGGYAGQHLPPGFVSGSIDGKPVAPLLPARKEWTHFSKYAATGFSTSYLQAYDDHVAAARFTPRGVASTDVEIFWLVGADAKPNDVDVERMMALWDRTYREDRWIVENNQHGLSNSRYAFKGGQPYAANEGGPAGFVKWYMREVAPHAGTSTGA